MTAVPPTAGPIADRPTDRQPAPDGARDAAFMARALQLAERGAASTHPNPRVGCVIVAGDAIVGEGWHERAGEPHAEVHALRAAGERARGATAYVTLEPCAHHGRTPPCAEALVAAGVARVVAAMEDPNPLVAGRGLATLRAAGIAVDTGVLGPAARELNRGFVSRLVRARPHVVLKLGASLDGRTATARGESQWITGEPARQDVHRLRGRCGAVLTTAPTVLADDPQLNLRRDGVVPRQNDRIVFDSQARVPLAARVWAAGARRWWIVGRRPERLPEGVEVIELPPGADGHVDPAAALTALAGAGVNELLVECGPGFAGALLQAGLVDELLLYLAPSLIGDDGRGLARFAGRAGLDQRLRLRYTDVRRIGSDLRITAVPETVA